MSKASAHKAALETLKAEAVQRVRLKRERPADVAHALGIDPPVLAAWLAKATVPKMLAENLRERARLKAEIERLETEKARMLAELEVGGQAQAFSLTHEE
jgi:transposase-like protein